MTVNNEIMPTGCEKKTPPAERDVPLLCKISLLQVVKGIGSPIQ